MGWATRITVVALAVAVTCGGIAKASDSEWWDTAYKFRRIVTVTDTVRGAGPTSAALVDFPTLGNVNANGGDIRVRDYDGNDVKVQVLTSGLEDRACILFEAPKHGKYQLYFGNPERQSYSSRLRPFRPDWCWKSRAFVEAPGRQLETDAGCADEKHLRNRARLDEFLDDDVV